VRFIQNSKDEEDGIRILMKQPALFFFWWLEDAAAAPELERNPSLASLRYEWDNSGREQ